MRYLLALGLLLAAPLAAQNTTGFADNRDCRVVAGEVTSAVEAGTGCLVMSSVMADFAKLRNALTPDSSTVNGWSGGTGDLICSAEHVEIGLTGCTVTGDVVIGITRDKAGLAMITIILQSIVMQKDTAANPPFVPTRPTIGGGNPG